MDETAMLADLDSALRKICRRLSHKSSLVRDEALLSEDDLYQEARLLAIEASRAWDGRGTREGYIRWRVKKRLVDAVREVIPRRDHSPIRFRNYLRGPSLDARNADGRPTVPPPGDPDAGPEQLAVEADAAAAIYARIDRLPARLRVVVRGCITSTEAEVGRTLGVTESRVCQLLRAARLRLTDLRRE